MYRPPDRPMSCTNKPIMTLVDVTSSNLSYWSHMKVITITVSSGIKLNTGNFESSDTFLSATFDVSGEELPLGILYNQASREVQRNALLTAFSKGAMDEASYKRFSEISKERHDKVESTLRKRHETPKLVK